MKSMANYVDVAVSVHARKVFSYEVPACLKDRASVGMRALVPFGRKLVTGYIVAAMQERRAGEYKLRRISELLDDEPVISADLIETARWIADYYFAPPGEVIRALLPAGTEVVGTYQIKLCPRTAVLLEGGFRPPELRSQENRILDALVESGALSIRQLKEHTGLRGAEQWIDSLIAAKWVYREALVAKARVRTKENLGIRALPADPDKLGSLTTQQARLYLILEPGGEPIPLQELLRTVDCTLSVAKALQRKGLVEIADVVILREPEDLAGTMLSTRHSLTEAQRGVLDELCRGIHRLEAARFLLHGVTGSGKTEIYLGLIAEVLRRGETAILLVPEIGLTPVLTRLVVSRFPGRVSLLHSGMSPGERLDQWHQIRERKVSVVVGTRSAVFAPLEKPRLIIIDEEQDSSYKQDDSPCYHAREVAWYRLQRTQGVLLLGSATPSIETYHLAVSTGEIRHLCLPERIEAKPLPAVSIVDMNAEFQRQGKKGAVSELLRCELEECVKRGEQAIVLLNRRGYSRTLLCRSCGNVCTCAACSVSMTYHQEEGRLVCHYCGLERNTPSACDQCGGQYIYFVGVGTEQLEEMVRAMLPQARVARVDRDTTRRQGSIRKILFAFAERKLDILVGTQMLAKGHDFPNVTLVGVMAADAGLSFPDFRSAERTFQLLTQVAGRAGRGTRPGRVIIQSYYPDHYALKFAQQQDYSGFYKHEAKFRKAMGYPPYRGLIQIVVTHEDLNKSCGIANRVAETLKACGSRIEPQSRPMVLGPAAAPIEKLRGQYRQQVLIKTPVQSAALSMLESAFAYLERQKISTRNVRVDVDPLSLL